MPKDTIIKYGNVEVNEGNGFNPTTGKFTAPLDGVFSFFWTFQTEKGSSVYLCGFVNEKIRACSGIYEGASTWQNTPGHSVAKLEKGEQFWVKNYYFSTPIIHEKYTYLSGYRIFGC